jgi:hypothetical protein
MAVGDALGDAAAVVGASVGTRVVGSVVVGDAVVGTVVVGDAVVGAAVVGEAEGATAYRLHVTWPFAGMPFRHRVVESAPSPSPSTVMLAVDVVPPVHVGQSIGLYSAPPSSEYIMDPVHASVVEPYTMVKHMGVV